MVRFGQGYMFFFQMHVFGIGPIVGLIGSRCEDSWLSTCEEKTSRSSCQN